MLVEVTDYYVFYTLWVQFFLNKNFLFYIEIGY